MWKSRASNWYLDTRVCQAKRRGKILVDPHGRIFALIANQFKDFENRRHLTVFQPVSGRLTVILPRLELLFFVNSRNLLECPQLRSEIDPNQDCGTWYGLRSKLILIEVVKKQNPTTGQMISIQLCQRSVLVPMGELQCKIDGPHVTVNVDNNGDYGRYM